MKRFDINFTLDCGRNTDTKKKYASVSDWVVAALDSDSDFESNADDSHDDGSDNDGSEDDESSDEAGFDRNSKFYNTSLSKVSKFLAFDQMPNLTTNITNKYLHSC